MHFQQEIKKQCDPCPGHRHHPHPHTPHTPPPAMQSPSTGKPRPHRHGAGGAGRSHSGRRRQGIAINQHLTASALPQTVISAARHGGHYRRDESRAGTAAGGDKSPTGAGSAPLRACRPCRHRAWPVTPHPAPLWQQVPSSSPLPEPLLAAADLQPHGLALLCRWQPRCHNPARLSLPHVLSPLSHEKQPWGLMKNKHLRSFAPREQKGTVDKQADCVCAPLPRHPPPWPRPVGAMLSP